MQKLLEYYYKLFATWSLAWTWLFVIKCPWSVHGSLFLVLFILQPFPFPSRSLSQFLSRLGCFILAALYTSFVLSPQYLAAKW